MDFEFYDLLKLPSFALPPNLIGLFWFIMYILITISIFIVNKKINILKSNDYLYMLITNYLSNQLFLLFFFKLMSPFLGFIITTITSLSTIFLYLETKKISKTASYFLIPYVIFNTYNFVVMLTLYLMNF